MRELRFDGLSPDGTRLILSGKDGQKWSVVIDERVEAAVRRDRSRISQLEIEQSGGLRPREIQARIRAGATAEDVAAASGLPVEHVRRFEGPILRERDWVARQAQATEVRRPGGDIQLAALVAERLADDGVGPEDIVWDAWRGDDGLWVVTATFPIPPNTHVATWTYDSATRTMTVADENARTLTVISPDAPLRLVEPRPALAPVVILPELNEVRWEDEAAEVPVRTGQVLAGPAAAHGEDDDEEDEGDDLPGPDPDDDEDDEEESEDAIATTDVPMEIALAETLVPAPAAPEESEPRAAQPEPAEVDVVDAPAAAPEETAPEDVEAQEAQPEPSVPEPAVPLFAAPAAPASPKHPGRPTIPSFDDILFGPAPKH
ncbi:MAG: septation protein SepH [Candidatus Nanopelagicales bacterium]